MPTPGFEHVHKPRDKETNNTFSCLHINIHSLPSKCDRLETILDQFEALDIKLDFILLCETFLNDQNKPQNITQRYNLITNNRQLKTRGGGVAIYVLDKYSYKLRQDVQIK